MSSFPIFKVNYINQKNTIDKILVFYGFHLEVADPTELFVRDPTNSIFQNIFDKNQLQQIKEKHIEIEFVKQSIHTDDTIGVIKLKIADAFKKNISEEEMYLYCLQKELLNPVAIYQMLTLNDKIPLTHIRLDQLLLNIYDEDGTLKTFPELEKNENEKEKYTFDDILKLDLENQNYYVSKPLGQRFIMGPNEYPIIADPFQIQKYDTLLERSRKEISTTNNTLLLDTGFIIKNNIYLCLAEDVFHYSELHDISSEYSSKLYYPFLYKRNINDVDELLLKKQK
jgi:hypothetical protein